MLQIYNETLESLEVLKINLATYEDLKADMQIIPKELVEAGMRTQKTVADRRTELEEGIATKEKTLVIINKRLDEETNLENGNEKG